MPGAEPPASRRARWIVWSTIPALLMVIAFGLWLRSSRAGPTPVDQAWLDFVGLEPDTPAHLLAVLLAEVGGGSGAVICTGLLAAFFVLRRRFRAAGALVTTMLLAVAASEAFKLLFLRVRPLEQLYDSTGYSYPSGHSTGATALAVALVFIAARWRVPASAPPRPRIHWSIVPAVLWILGMMWSRTALQVHWLSDTIAGALIGISAAILADELWTWLEARFRANPASG
ncbi:undecaprenyl-diphosphatase [Brevibacterium sanguinis]|uniref:Undecaprenyl-diphosphatase n=2 Tax=Brevibacterium TaxID=1696 RepID=A0A366IR68_9MICO|nr:MULTISPECIES: phosphatase PAP2 family protein [Brevibacterium]RBP67976.1 undecaprenyl-diphosphatase [Brevibacterium sanguinis]RBP74607.1 undecaprenyl-diphosphatase [Brevibacterium celere]